MKNAIFIIVIMMFLINIYTFSQEEQDFECGLKDVEELLSKDILIPRPILSGPVSYAIKSKIRVHYTLSGKDATTLAFAESIATYAQYNWDIQCGQLGWDEPPSDGTMGGDSRYDIYITDTSLTSGFTTDGQAVPERKTSNPNQNEYTSWIQIWKKIIGKNSKYHKFVVSHEFNHASQLSYTRDDMKLGGTWFYENTATWIPKQVYPIMDKHRDFINNSYGPLYKPYEKITSIGSSQKDTYEYGGALWCFLLSEWKNDISIIRKFWERMGQSTGQQIIKDLEFILRNNYSDSLKNALENYAIWRYFTAERADSYHFSEAASYPTSVIYREHDSNDFHTYNQGTKYPSGPGGTSYIKYYPRTEIPLLNLNFNGQNKSV